MGITYVTGEVRGESGRPRTVRFLMDSGAAYSVLPRKVWQALHLKPKRSLEFTLADGTTIARKVTECRFSLLHGEGHTPVVLGEEGDRALLGSVTLEVLGLVLNPFSRTLHPMQMLLA